MNGNTSGTTYTCVVSFSGTGGLPGGPGKVSSVMNAVQPFGGLSTYRTGSLDTIAWHTENNGLCMPPLVGGSGMLPVVMADYLGLTNLKYMDGTAVGGSSPVYHIGHAAAAIAMGKCNIALVSLANRPRSEAQPCSLTPSPARAIRARASRSEV